MAPLNRGSQPSATGKFVSLFSHRFLVAVTVSVLFATRVPSALAQGPSTNATTPPQVQDFDWDNIAPSAELQWTTCYTVFHCARFPVPLDYSDPDGEKAAIAIIKFPSQFPQGDERYRGPILFNPGGPGVSGVELVLVNAASYQAVIGDDFDYIGFDPRGVGRTTPQLDIFSSRQESLILQRQLTAASNTSTESLGTLYGIAQIVGNLALNRARRYAEHVSTPAVARDMMGIVNAHGLDKLQYWGVSYGTVLGATFAAMFPENVGRVILDGVVDAESYYAAQFSDGLADADLTLSTFYDDCVKAGPEICPIFESTVEQISQRVNNVLERLKVAPVPFVNATDGSHGLVGYSVVKNVLFQTLYAPHILGALFAGAFAALEVGNSEGMWRLSGEAMTQELLYESCSPEANKTLIADFVTAAIGCGDGAPVEDTLDDLRVFMENLSEQSTFADVWNSRVYCAAWRIQATDKFQGTFTTNTSYPILFIGNTADPATPLRSAHKMAEGFAGSVVLQQNSPGHSSLSATSVCTALAVRDYFRNGILPDPSTICEVESSTFGIPANNNTLHTRGSNEFDKVLWEASAALQRNHRRVRSLI